MFRNSRMHLILLLILAFISLWFIMNTLHKKNTESGGCALAA